jgi:hypothetical protein
MDDHSIPKLGLTAPPGVAVLIAAAEPGRALLDVVEPLVRAEAAAIVVVDDGSSSARKWVLERISMEPTVHLLRHGRPQGRGAALKTGMHYITQHLQHYIGLVTTTADGRYGAADVVRLMRALRSSPKLVILGAPESINLAESARARNLHRSLQNRLLGLAFQAKTRIPLSDVQTGLRAIPAGLLPQLLSVPGERYDYEFAVLLHIARHGYPMAEQAVFGTMDHPGPDERFRPFADSFSMLRALLHSTPVEAFAVEEETGATRKGPRDERRSGASKAQQTR